MTLCIEIFKRRFHLLLEAEEDSSREEFFESLAFLLLAHALHIVYSTGITSACAKPGCFWCVVRTDLVSA
jgi:hypothetical protein